MRIKIVNPDENFDKTIELVVIIDVLRAFTTACYIFERGAKIIFPVLSLEDAYKLKEKHDDYILVGERNGTKPRGFDFGNSPFEISKADLRNKKVIFTTTSGTSAIYKTIKAKEMITGAFVNAKAVCHYIKKFNPETVIFFCTDNRFKDAEDYMLAVYLKKILEGSVPNFEDVKNLIIKHPSVYGYLKKPLTPYSVEDFNLCMGIDKIDFVIKKSLRDKHICLVRI